ncbi:hypothetical protein TspCOW1_06340 [Thiohalobacter sp. COW1]|uniref:V-type ATP synthase subunit E n=1 Tax=Thiohalobacter thiocyanaticus TaxID=585455 RepID=A0A1Z4VRY8_9GAMM|nr:MULTISPECIES: V-type ATP synthase subunit E family protein [Thiohalobacter]BAZ94400.1 archaeal/vacuolar-type H+-ATPase subunit E [Thiohalobacter thiocyanaticus]BCO30531.1 hypothetical protein TspCOW1_06340 [Thiohalobacter sp. COW1]
MTPDVQTSTEALRRLIRESAEAQCREIEQQTRVEARDLLRRSRREACERVHQTIEHERQQHARRLDHERAALESHDRQQLLEATRRTLGRAWQELEGMLAALWQAHECRSEWIRSLFEQALERLPPGHWRIEHPLPFPEEIDADWQRRLREYNGREPEWIARAGIRAGLRIRVGGVHLDATLDGLLADRTQLEARLLDHIERCMDIEAGGSPHG